MRRVTLTGDGLAGFTPVAPDQQVKLFFARDGGVPEVPDPPADLDDVSGWYQRYLAMPDDRRPWLRTYSIRRHRPEERQVDVDFVLHGDGGGHDGPAARWAAAARPGDVIGLYGPSVSHLRTPGRHDWKLFAGDETALPAIGAWLESLGPDDHAVVVAEVAGPEEEQRFQSRASVTVTWWHRGGVPAGRSTALTDAVRALEFPDGEPFAWVAGEASAVREVRRHLVGERGIDRRAVAFSGYWRVDRSHDDASTAEELADHEEAAAV
ncbi:siderophore-interacting protein [Jiangella rhizosphaerae]|uniref:Siderophore-interacting protein n=2 Tax=Jiangella rhizosphaerae TaxID=2293569 RepID=A0A418KTR7_9ACTN|nr:siderophore-interacting protein [Jiangella rhizosphaerae]